MASCKAETCIAKFCSCSSKMQSWQDSYRAMVTGITRLHRLSFHKNSDQLLILCSYSIFIYTFLWGGSKGLELLILSNRFLPMLKNVQASFLLRLWVKISPLTKPSASLFLLKLSLFIIPSFIHNSQLSTFHQFVQGFPKILKSAKTLLHPLAWF